MDTFVITTTSAATVTDTAMSHKTTTLKRVIETESLFMNSTPTAVLGALLGLSVVLLAVVTTGWVWTCCIMKKGEGEKSLVQKRLGTTSAIAFR